MELKKSNNKEKTAQVLCDVTSCVYQTHDRICHAGEINVGPTYASTTDDTICATFKQKD